MPKSHLITTARMERTLGIVLRVFGFFKDYLKHLGVFSSTIAVVLMGCALKGQEKKFTNGLTASLTIFEK